MRSLTIAFMMFLCTATASAVQADIASAVQPVEITDSVAINFRQSKIFLDTTYMDNAASLRGMRERLNRYIQGDSIYSLAGVSVVGAASPEGSVKFNQWLSERRAEKIFNYISGITPLPVETTSFSFLGRDWRGLLNEITADPDVPFKKDVQLFVNQVVKALEGGGRTALRPVSRTA